MSNSHSYYDKHTSELIERYNSVTFERVHSSWKPFWPSAGESVLDVGAGSGRDAKWMAQQGADVIAIEPSANMREFGREHTGEQVTWLDDRLPSLKKTEQLGMRFDVILVSAVWMHLAPSNRARAFRKLSNLLRPNGRLVLTVKHGETDDSRGQYQVSVEEIEQFAKDAALLVQSKTKSADSLSRESLSWSTVVLSLPEDGSGDLIKVRHIIVNDSKSSTYKLALLRVLLRLADAHPGCVMDRTDGQVKLPLGLVALYWIKAYKRLIDVQGVQQSSNSSKGLAFVTDEGWNKLTHLSADDLSVGAVFLADEASAVQKTIADAIHAMKSGPIRYIKTGRSSEAKQQFHTVAAPKRRIHQQSVYLDSTFFESFGGFVLDESLWECLRIYNSWIEPLVVNQWISEMQRFELNRTKQISLQSYHDGLLWLDKSHDTSAVRRRLSELQQQNHPIYSVWGGNTPLSKIEVDHCVPFTYWPNNERWNLLPSLPSQNNQKRDRLPSRGRLKQSHQRIVDWWELAWGEQELDRKRFFTEASFSLPNIPPQCDDFEEVFESMGLQIRGVKSRLLVNEW